MVIHKIKTHLYLIILSIIFIQTSAYAAEIKPIVAVISAASNVVEIKQPNWTKWQAAGINYQLADGYQIRTGSGSMVEATFLKTGSKVRLAAMSQMTIEDKDDKITFSFGKLFLAVVKGKGGMKFKTPVAVAAVLGTVGVIEYTPAAGNEPDIYSVTSMDGTFAVSDNAGNTKELTTGNMAKLTPEGIMVVPADVLNVLKVNTDIMQATFIKVGLPPENIIQTPQGEVIRLNTGNPNQTIEMNQQNNSIDLIDTSKKGDQQSNNTVDVPEIPVIQLPPTIPYIQSINLPIVLK